MQLPKFLEADEQGFVSLTGHRIGLHHVVSMYEQGASSEMIAAHYPSLPLADIHKVIAFYLENQADVDAYVVDHNKEIAKQITAGPVAPSVTELRQRLQLSATASNPG